MTASWADLLRGGNLARSAVVGGGIVMHAINVFIVTTILPSVVHDIGGLRFFAWSTTLYVVASLVGGAVTTRVLARLGPRRSYRVALALFALGSAGCALAPVMAALLAGRLVQGLGAGMLSSLAFTMIRVLFPEPLWARAISIISAMWGIATLLGPAVGGVFAQFGAWRAGFWTLAAIAPLLAVLVERSMPADVVGGARPRARLATGNLALLAASVLCVSVGSMAGGVGGRALALLLAATGLAIFVLRERGGAARLLPRGAVDPRTRLGATYAAMLMLLLGMSTEIFVPYFLQNLHGATPLHAGYMAAMMSGGWAVGSLTSSSAAPTAARRAVSTGPLTLAAGLAGLAMLMPGAGGGVAALIGIALCLAAVGLGIGMGWPHLGAQVFRFAPDDEKELAAGSITTVIMVGNALGSALGGMVTNMAGLTLPGGAQTAAAWLFGLFAAFPVLGWLAVRRALTARAA